MNVTHPSELSHLLASFKVPALLSPSASSSHSVTPSTSTQTVVNSSSLSYPPSDFLPPLKPTREPRKRRERQSCQQCQARRCACSREWPCKACVVRGDGDQCDWKGAQPLIVQGRVASPSAQPGLGSPQLSAEADRLAQLARTQDQIRLNNDLRELANRVDRLVEILQTQAQITAQPSPLTSSSESHPRRLSYAPETVPVVNYHMEDVATQLSRFTLSQAIRAGPEHDLIRKAHSGPQSYSPRISVRELEEYMEQDQQPTMPQVNFNIGSHDAHWATATTAPIHPIPGKGSSSPIVSSAASAPTMQGLLGLGPGLGTITAVMKHLPTLLHIKSCLEQFEAHRAWMHRILHRQQFWEQVYEQILQDFATYRSSALHDIGLDEYRRRLHWLAIFFAICGLGLFNNLLDDSQALQLGFPSGKRPQRDLAVRWCVCSTSCLQLGEYDQHPTIESIQAMAILAQLPLYTSNGETLGIVLGFLGSAIELASKLGLNIDPDEDPRYVNASALVKQDRRRLMIALLCQHYKMGGLACQTLGLQSPSEYKIQLPLDQFDEDFDLTTGALINPRTPGSTHTIMTGVRCRFQVSQVWQEIGILFADVKTPLIHDKILALDRQLVEIEKNWPPCIRTHFEPSTATFVPSFNLQSDRPGLDTTTQHPILLLDRLGCFSVLANAMIRLHRGFLVAHDGIPSQDVALHRSRVLHFGRSMLAIHRTTLLPLDHVPLQFFVFSSSIALAVYCLTAKPESDEVGEVMKELIQLVETLKPITHVSSILRRTHGVMSYLIKKINVQLNEPEPVRKRSRLDSTGSNQVLRQEIPSQASAHQPPSHPTEISGLGPSVLANANKDTPFNISSFERLSRNLQQDIEDVYLAQGFDLNHDKSVAQAIKHSPENLFDLCPLLDNRPLSQDQANFIFGSTSTDQGFPQIKPSQDSTNISSPTPNGSTNGSFVFGGTSEAYLGLIPNVKF